jgi:hypothetical protein
MASKVPVFSFHAGYMDLLNVPLPVVAGVCVSVRACVRMHTHTHTHNTQHISDYV